MRVGELAAGGLAASHLDHPGAGAGSAHAHLELGSAGRTYCSSPRRIRSTSQPFPSPLSQFSRPMSQLSMVQTSPHAGGGREGPGSALRSRRMATESSEFEPLGSVPSQCPACVARGDHARGSLRRARVGERQRCRSLRSSPSSRLFRSRCRRHRSPPRRLAHRDGAPSVAGCDRLRRAHADPRPRSGRLFCVRRTGAADGAAAEMQILLTARVAVMAAHSARPAAGGSASRFTHAVPQRGPGRHADVRDAALAGRASDAAPAAAEVVVGDARSSHCTWSGHRGIAYPVGPAHHRAADAVRLHVSPSGQTTPEER
jgi:hypothetical protein